MERRAFLRTLIGGLAGAAAVRTWPFRVYSFPSEITNAIDPYFYDSIGHVVYYKRVALDTLKINFKFLPPGKKTITGIM